MYWIKYLIWNSIELFKMTESCTNSQTTRMRTFFLRSELQLKEDNQDCNLTSLFFKFLSSWLHMGHRLHVHCGKESPCSSRECPENLFEGLLFTLFSHSDSHLCIANLKRRLKFEAEKSNQHKCKKTIQMAKMLTIKFVMIPIDSHSSRPRNAGTQWMLTKLPSRSLSNLNLEKELSTANIDEFLKTLVNLPSEA